MDVLRRGPGPLLFKFFFFSWLCVAPTWAGIVNRTIDDTFGDSETRRQAIFLPTTARVWEDNLCSGCAIKPDITRAFKESYTAATYNPGLGNISITLDFNGTAIYVFFILANNAGDGITTLTMANFTMDSDAPVAFQHAPDLTTTDIQFNSLVYSRTDMINAQHRLVISTSGVNTNVYVNFDYAIYTHDDDAPLLPLPPAGSPTTSSSTTRTTGSVASQTRSQTNSPSSTAVGANSGESSTPIGPIVGGVVGGLAALALLIFGLLFCKRRRDRRQHELAELERRPPALMSELGPNDAQGASFVTPFLSPQAQSSTVASYYQHSYTGAPSIGSKGYQWNASTSNNHLPPPGPQSVSDGQSSSGQSSIPTQVASTGSSMYYHSEGTRRPLRTVTEGDHLSSPSSYSPSTSPATMKDREAIRRQRQDEIDRRLRNAQQEIMDLTSGFTDEKGARRVQSIRRPRAQDQGGGEEDEVLSMEEMRDQLRTLRGQIAFLQEQQNSAWAMGISDDPPPGYYDARPRVLPQVPDAPAPPIPGHP
ncbi:hypothetical protein NLJ89_g3492 [Agrocybe chaxingu]|uniref:Uncharacterized protein n=1 Tax=Agrocybe chaxingu TaxID=84603 RepID=A0A9W8K5J0_9AGAR|nr:hypothetical protein NLJ89_g3492 [Agrocybe chaxingu]